MPRNGFVSAATTSDFIPAAVPGAPGWEIRGSYTRAAAVEGDSRLPDVTVTAFVALVDPSLVDEADRDYSNGPPRTSRIPGGDPSIPGDGEDTSDAAAQARFYALADQLASEVPAPREPPAPPAT